MHRWQTAVSVAVLIVVATLGTGSVTGSVSGGDARVVTSGQAATGTQMLLTPEPDNRAAGGASLAQTDGGGSSPEGNSSGGSIIGSIVTNLLLLLLGTVFGGIAVAEYSQRRGKLSRIDEDLAAVVRGSERKSDTGQSRTHRPSAGPKAKAESVAELFRDGVGVAEIANFIDDLYQDRVTEKKEVDTAAEKVEILREQMDSDRSASVNSRDSDSHLRKACQRVRDDTDGLQEGGTADSLLSALEESGGADGTSPESLEQQLSVVVDKLMQHEHGSEPTPHQGSEIIGADPEEDVRNDHIAKQEQEIRELEEENQNLKMTLDKKNQLVDELEREVDTAWLQRQIDASDPETRLRRATELGKIDTAIIQQAAEAIGPAGSVEGQELIQTLEEPQSEQQIKEDLSTAVRRLSEWKQVAKQVEAADKDDLRRRIDVLQSQTTGTSVALKGIDSLLEVCQNDLERATARNSVELHSLEATLDRVERATQATDASLEGSHWQELSAETNRLREELDNLTQKGKLGISKGHQLSDVFIEVADELAAEARSSAENGDWGVARAQLEAAERVYQGVKRLYDNRKLRQLLQ